MYYKDYDKFKNQTYNYKVLLKNEIYFRLEDIKRRLEFYKETDDLFLIINEIEFNLHWIKEYKKIKKVEEYCDYIDTLLPLHTPLEITPIYMLRQVVQPPMMPYFPKVNRLSLLQVQSKLREKKNDFDHQ